MLRLRRWNKLPCDVSIKRWSSNKAQSHKELTGFQKLKLWMQPFMDGTKGLYVENKQAWEIRRRIKQNDSSSQLTRQEMMVLRQAHRDLIKSLPLLLFFAVPLVGYAAPLIGYRFPKQLLPWQFWRPSQKTEFFQEDAQARAHFYPQLVDMLLQMEKKDKCLQEMMALHGSKGLDPVQVTELIPFFDDKTQGPASISVLPRKHLIVLARSIALTPSFAWVWNFAQRPMIIKYLETRMEQLRVDDVMLLEEGIEELSLAELEFACEERGIVEGYGSIVDLRRGLKEWLAMYDPNEIVNLPTSLLLHAPALMNPSSPSKYKTMK